MPHENRDSRKTAGDDIVASRRDRYVEFYAVTVGHSRANRRESLRIAGDHGMELDDELCLCFHVSRRKVENFIRVERPRHVSQLAECFGAGTGCGWCREYLRILFERRTAGDSSRPAGSPPLPDADAYAVQRQDYIRAGKGTPPPGA